MRGLMPGDAMEAGPPVQRPGHRRQAWSVQAGKTLGGQDAVTLSETSAQIALQHHRAVDLSRSASPLRHGPGKRLHHGALSGHNPAPSSAPNAQSISARDRPSRSTSSS